MRKKALLLKSKEALREGVSHRPPDVFCRQLAAAITAPRSLSKLRTHSKLQLLHNIICAGSTNGSIQYKKNTTNHHGNPTTQRLLPKRGRQLRTCHGFSFRLDWRFSPRSDRQGISRPPSTSTSTSTSPTVGAKFATATSRSSIIIGRHVEKEK